MSERQPQLPAGFRDDPDVRLLTQEKSGAVMAIMHLINCAASYDTPSKDYEFSRETMLGHWQSGKADTERSLADPRWTGRVRRDGVLTFDLARGCI